MRYLQQSRKEPFGNGLKPAYRNYNNSKSADGGEGEGGLDGEAGRLLYVCNFPYVEGSGMGSGDDAMFANYKTKNGELVHYYVRKVVNEVVEEIAYDIDWQYPPEPTELFSHCMVSPEEMTNWPYPLPPLKGTPPHPFRPTGRAGSGPPPPCKYGEFPPSCLSLEVIVEEEPPPEEVPPEEVDRTRIPVLQDIDGDGMPDEMVDVDGDGDFENIATILVGAPIMLDTATPDATIFYTVDGFTPRLPSMEEVEADGCVDYREWFEKLAMERGDMDGESSFTGNAGTGRSRPGTAGKSSYEVGREEGVTGESSLGRSNQAAGRSSQGDISAGFIGSVGGVGVGGGGGGGGGSAASKQVEYMALGGKTGNKLRQEVSGVSDEVKNAGAEAVAKAKAAAAAAAGGGGGDGAAGGGDGGSGSGNLSVESLCLIAGNAAVEGVKSSGKTSGLGRKELEVATRLAAGVTASETAISLGASTEEAAALAGRAAAAVAITQGAVPKEVARAAAAACIRAGGGQQEAKEAAVTAATDAVIAKDSKAKSPGKKGKQSPKKGRPLSAKSQRWVLVLVLV
jgi:hypothetical protein